MRHTPLREQLDDQGKLLLLRATGALLKHAVAARAVTIDDSIERRCAGQQPAIWLALNQPAASQLFLELCALAVQERHLQPQMLNQMSLRRCNVVLTIGPTNRNPPIAPEPRTCTTLSKTFQQAQHSHDLLGCCW